MKHLTKDEWERKYIARPIERMDQKYIGFNRARWDEQTLIGEKTFREWGKKLYGLVMPSDKPGDTLQDFSFKNAAWYLEFGFGFGNAKGQQGLYAWDSTQIGVSRAPQGLKIDASDPPQITRDIKKVATYFGADLVGVTRRDERWIYTDYYDLRDRKYGPVQIPEDCKYVIAMAFEMDYELIKYSPAQVTDAAPGMGYSKMAFTTGLLAQFIRGIGYKAIPCGNDTAMSTPIALQAGLGELGRNGLLITPEYGPRVRLSKVFTDLPLASDEPIEFGVTEFCQQCNKCAHNCPSQAIMYGERTTKPHNISNVSGELKWPVDAERCFSFWARHSGPCSNCLRVCPFNKDMNWFHKTSRWFVDNIRWADPLYRKLDDLFGYGKQKKADNFWDEWKPRQALRTTRG